MNFLNLDKIGIGYGKGESMAVSAVNEAFNVCTDMACLQKVAVVVSGGMSLEDATNAAKYAQDQVGDNVNLSVNLSYKEGSDKCTAYVLTFAKEYEDICEKDVREKYDPDEIVDAITTTVCSNFGVDFRDLVSDHDTPGLQMPRELIMYFCREFTDMDLDAIGYVTKDEYVAVMAAISKITQLMKTKENLLSFIKYLEQQILDTYRNAGAFNEERH